jgi:hypothetical protein
MSHRTGLPAFRNAVDVCLPSGGHRLMTNWDVRLEAWADGAIRGGVVSTGNRRGGVSLLLLSVLPRLRFRASVPPQVPLPGAA